MIIPWSFCWCIISVLMLVDVTNTEDFYQLLNISKYASTTELRRAFKKAALKFHPDKNQDNPAIHDKFVRINRAYETLRDADSRRRYDLHGEEGVASASSPPPRYQSWSYYHDNFGIYDDDPQIVTLDRADFDEAVRESQDTWFINFYSPGCGHCHTLAPVWRRLARELEHVVRVGAVNCAEDWQLCRREAVHGYPELVIYPEGWRYQGERSFSALLAFVLRRLHVAPIDVDAANVRHLTGGGGALAGRPWLLVLCGDDGPDCPGEQTRLQLTAMLEGAVTVGQVDCSETTLCDALGGPSAYPVYFAAGAVTAGGGRPIRQRRVPQIVAELLQLLPPPANTISDQQFQAMRAELESAEPGGGRLPWLLQLDSGSDSDSSSLALLRLPSLLASTSFSRLSCGRYPHVCNQLHVSARPGFVLWRPGGGYELYHGAARAADVAAFARLAAAGRLRSLTPQQAAAAHSRPLLLCFYHPGCRPCQRLLPQLRAASRRRADLTFGAVDCSAHAAFCGGRQVRSYPTVVLETAAGRRHQYRGAHAADALLQFVDDALSPAVLALDSAEQLTRARSRPAHQLWLIDYYADWCSPCQQFAAQFSRVARQLRQLLPDIVVATVDCAEQRAFCSEQSVHSYPTVRLYTAGSAALHTYSQLEGYQDWEQLSAWVAGRLPDGVSELSGDSFLPRVLDGRGPWLVDFYAPWCHHCRQFAPVFRTVALALEGGVQCGRLDCARHPTPCRQAGVGAYPTVRLYRGGGLLDMVGAEVAARDPVALVAFVRDKLRVWREQTDQSSQGSRPAAKDEL